MTFHDTVQTCVALSSRIASPPTPRIVLSALISTVPVPPSCHRPARPSRRARRAVPAAACHRRRRRGDRRWAGRWRWSGLAGWCCLLGGGQPQVNGPDRKSRTGHTRGQSGHTREPAACIRPNGHGHGDLRSPLGGSMRTLLVTALAASLLVAAPRPRRRRSPGSRARTSPPPSAARCPLVARNPVTTLRTRSRSPRRPTPERRDCARSCRTDHGPWRRVRGVRRVDVDERRRSC